MRRATTTAAGALAATALAVTSCGGQDSAGEADEGSGGAMVLATTTSTQNSGLLGELIPAFQSASECSVKTVAVGSGQAMRLGEQGDADVVLSHSPEAEEEFMAAGHGLSREPVMFNDFVITGPDDDPAGIDDGGTPDAGEAADALAQLAEQQHAFASRADDSGTHAREMSLWDGAGVQPGGEWYVETGQGMGETLTIASQQQAYTLTDRGTFLATSGLESTILFEGTEDLRNDYHVLVVDHEAANRGCAEDFAGWVRDDPAQELIGEFGVDRFGEALFTPDAG